MSERRQQSQFAAWSMIGLVVTCLLGASAAATLRPRYFANHREAISYVLDRQGIAHEQIRLMHLWPDTMNRRAYAAHVVVQLSSARRVGGRIECASGRSSCRLYLPELGITREPVPELDPVPIWLAWLRKTLRWPSLLGHAP
jgi:hypothetical protein